jgi:hypothetical protein
MDRPIAFVLMKLVNGGFGIRLEDERRLIGEDLKTSPIRRLRFTSR